MTICKCLVCVQVNKFCNRNCLRTDEIPLSRSYQCTETQSLLGPSGITLGSLQHILISQLEISSSNAVLCRGLGPVHPLDWFQLSAWYEANTEVETTHL